MYLHSLAFHKLAPKCFLAIVLQVEHDLVPAVIEFERHATLKGLDASDRLIVGADEGAFDVFIIQNSDFEPEILVHLC